MSTTKPANERDQNRGPELLITTWVFTALAIVIVSLKLYTRLRIIKQTGVDDALVIFSTVLILTCTILFTIDVGYGMGRHIQSLPLDDAIKAVKINLIANPFGIMAYSLPNIAVAIFIDRILSLSHRKQAALYTLVISQNLIAAVSCVLIFTQCNPTASLWDPTVNPVSCLSGDVVTHYSYFVGGYTAFTDVVLAIVPIWTFRKLQMARKAKVATSIIMSMTLAAAICACYKTSKLWELARLEDFTYDTVDLIIAAVVEANVIIIAACIPSLRPFVRVMIQTMNQSTTRRKLKRPHPTPEVESRMKNFHWLKLSSMGGTTVLATSASDRTSGADGAGSNQDSTFITKTTDISVELIGPQMV